MWTHDRIKPKDWKGEWWSFAQYKRDGHRLTFFKQSNGDVLAFGREVRADLEYVQRFGEVIKALPFFKTFERYAPSGTSLDGEIFVVGQPASFVPTALRDPKAGLVFEAFALPVYAGRAFRHTFQFADDFEAAIRNLGAEPVPQIDPAILCDAIKVGDSMIVNLIKKAKIEGFVLKQSHLDGWYKLKPVSTVDAVVTGTKDGNGKYLGLLGALSVSVYDDQGQLKEIANVSGMTDAQRVVMTEMEDRGEILGMVCEVQYQYVGAKGRLRHPVFLRWREDKPKQECTSDQLI